MDALELRHIVYSHFERTGAAPSRAALAETVGDEIEVDRLLRELHDGHMLVLDDWPARVGEIRMALPSSADPTDFTVTSGQRTWWANCAWDSLAILAALHVDGRIESTWSDTGDPVDITITDGRPDQPEGFVHFAVPARRWWDDIVRT